MINLVYVGVGGFLGANARYALTLMTDRLLVARWGVFPYGTLLVNVLGSFGLALFSVWFSARAGLPPQLRLLVGAGFFGAFTTFSAFANDSVNLLADGSAGAALINILLSNGLCLLGVALGLHFGNRLFLTA